MKINTILGEDLKPVIILGDLKDLEEIARRWKQEIWETDLAYYLLTPNYIWKAFKKTDRPTEAEETKVGPLSLKESTEAATYPVEYKLVVPT